MSDSASDGIRNLPTDRRALLAGLGGLAAGTFLTASRAEAGTLNPPGAPAPTPGPEPRIAVNEVNTPGRNTLADYVISQPGSYYLRENLNVQRGPYGIRIEANNVTLDLNGFAVIGIRSIQTRSGIYVHFENSNVVIKNGIVCDWENYGISMAASSANHCTVENVTAQNNRYAGITVGSGCRVHGCIASGNQVNGIVAYFGSIISDCVVYSNGATGISTHGAAHITGCSVYENGRDGIRTYTGSLVVRNVLRSNSEAGIITNSHGYILENCITGSSGTGILVEGSGARIEGNQCRGMSTGMRVTGQNCFIARNTCSANTVNWDIAANNKCLVVQGMNAPAILGNSGGADPGSDHPFANFTVSGTG